MSRVRLNSKGASAHEVDLSTSVRVEKFIDKLLERQHELAWFGSRTTDLIRLECLFDGMHLKLVYAVPEGHQDYVYSIGMSSFYSGKRDEEITLQLIDISKRWGRSKVIDEWFEPFCSPLFDHTLAAFDLIREHVDIKMWMTTDRIGYPDAIREATEILSKM